MMKYEQYGCHFPLVFLTEFVIDHLLLYEKSFFIKRKTEIVVKRMFLSSTSFHLDQNLSMMDVARNQYEQKSVYHFKD